MLFDEPKPEPKKAERPALPAGFDLNYRIGFLFNFVSGKSTRFDLEPVLIYPVNGKTEYKRISLQVEKGLALLHSLDNQLYDDLMEFSDNQLLQWMTRTGNRFIRNHSGTWAHVSARELVNLRRHYIELLHKLWPALSQWPDLFVLKAGRFNNYQQQTVKLGQQPANFSFKVERSGQLISIKMILKLDGQESDLNLWGGFMFEKDGTLYLPPDKEALTLIDLFKNGPLTFPLTVKKEVINKYVTPWLDKYEISISDKLNIELVSPEAQPRVFLTELNESNLMLRPQFAYSDDVVLDYSEERNHVMETKDKVSIIRRNKDHEQKLYEYLRTLHSSFNTQRNNQYYYLPFADVMKKGWFITMMRKVADQGYAVHGLHELKKFRYTTHVPRFTITASNNVDWFDLKVTIQWGEHTVSLKEIRHAILNKQDTIMLEDGTLGHIPEEWISQYSLLLRTGTEENGTLRVSKLHYTLLEDILDKIDGNTVQQDIEARKHKLLQFDSIEKVPLSSEIKASLRPYQQSGFHWLQALDELGWGGCLADDMGLGKTLQTISFLQYLKEKYPGSTQLVVCPTSLIFNWENEIQKFCPTLKFYIHYGLQRQFSEAHFNDYDVVLTTYGVVRNDLEELNNFLWQYIILDESQAIKNPDARVTKAVQQLRAVNRVILSGTPVQNNTSDLFAQFNFLNPGLLGSREFFNREFAQPIDKFGSKEKTLHLKKLIHPFTLRRTKEQVAKDLPDKTVTVLWCTMDAEQRKLYNHYRDGYRNSLLKKIDEQGIGKSGVYVLEGLLRLRQICDHPALLKDTANEMKSSVKIEELVREVQENAGNHKLLIFSQFTEMLQLIKAEFEEAGISHCYLDGSTSLPNRKEEVTRFQEDESIKAFLISLKAGGVGLNLTVADYVYLVDPWWNPAAEQQAIDRAHRIGQTRKVFAYKMICKDTVEEKILQLQERKKMLADDLIQEDAGFVKSLSREDVEFLFG
ncbi:DEAD/DEAH box helicase [Fulvivirgaceae bacterium PWU4]|uniref:DEAD/DEAH box helicase n=1 Tax=Chryseosolibacter histidini TaxID=2782349 RepID=A0AAP2DHH9_9BACT|nr:DEAD/DEAH box helicase [Chryseosolibacter histidini]MBT1695297.1 DEAD/DEAH box helicase [Chryseosolibacter histidini]